MHDVKIELSVVKCGDNQALRLPFEVAAKMRLVEDGKVEPTMDESGHATLRAAAVFDKAAWLAEAHALTARMPQSELGVRTLRDADRC